MTRDETRYEEDQLERYYDRFYFETYAFGESYRPDNPFWQRLFGGMADTIVAEIGPATALDSGCGPGLLVAALRDRGVEAWGIDISDYAIANVRDDIRPYCKVASVTEDLERDYDLILSIEVLEHLPRHLADRAIEVLTTHTNDILFSSTSGGFEDPSHQNAQASDYWIGMFGRHGFFRDLSFDAGFISEHALRLRRAEGAAAVLSILRSYERSYSRVLEELKVMRKVNVGIVEDRSHLTAEVERLRAEAERLKTLVEAGPTVEVEQLQTELQDAQAELARFRGLEQGRTWRLVRSLLAAKARLRGLHP
jgi:SAM-dependent methyltransferase